MKNFNTIIVFGLLQILIGLNSFVDIDNLELDTISKDLINTDSELF